MCQLKGFTIAPKARFTPLASLGKRGPTFSPVLNSQLAKKPKLPITPVVGQTATPAPCPNNETPIEIPFSSSPASSVLPVVQPQHQQQAPATQAAPQKPTLSLIQAARTGAIGVVKQLVEEGDNINQEVMGCTALHYAAFYNRKDIVEFLISMGAELNAKNSSGLTPLAWAVDRGLVDIAWMLLEAEADPAIADSKGNTPLHKATTLKNSQMVETLLSINTDEDEWCKVNARNAEGCTSAYFAAFQGSNDILQILIDFQANINLPSFKNITPLHRAVSANRLDTVKMLLENGARVNDADDNGRTALHLAASSNNIELVKLLLEHGPTLSLDARSMTALQIADSKKYTELVEILQEYSASL